MGIVEIIVILVVAIIVIPPDNLPDVMRATGKVLRELRLASNMVMLEIGGALDQLPPPRSEPPTINTMRPRTVATNDNIAQSAASADAIDSAASAKPADPMPAPVTVTPASTDATASASDAPKSTDATASTTTAAEPADPSATPIAHS